MYVHLCRSNVLFEPRALTLTYAAATNEIPIVLANLVTEIDELQKTAYNFETAQHVSWICLCGCLDYRGMTWIHVCIICRF